MQEGVGSDTGRCGDRGRVRPGQSWALVALGCAEVSSPCSAPREQRDRAGERRYHPLTPLARAGPGLPLTGAGGQQGLGAVAPQDGEGGAEILAGPQYLGVHAVARPRRAVLRQKHGGPAETVGGRPRLGGRVLREACGAGALSGLGPGPSPPRIPRPQQALCARVRGEPQAHAP